MCCHGLVRYLTPYVCVHVCVFMCLFVGAFFCCMTHVPPFCGSRNFAWGPPRQAGPHHVFLAQHIHGFARCRLTLGWGGLCGATGGERKTRRDNSNRNRRDSPADGVAAGSLSLSVRAERGPSPLMLQAECGEVRGWFVVSVAVCAELPMVGCRLLSLCDVFCVWTSFGGRRYALKRLDGCWCLECQAEMRSTFGRFPHK